MGMTRRLALALLAAGMVAACGGGDGGSRLRYGWQHADDGSALWLAIDGRVDLILATRPARVKQKVENWDGEEFNVYYEVLLGGDRRVTRILLWGDLERGVLTGSFGTEALDLEHGNFIKEADPLPVPMEASEKQLWLSRIEP